MKNKKILPIFLILPLSMSFMVGCGAKEAPATPSADSLTQQTQEVVNPEDRLEANGFEAVENQIETPNAQKFGENNVLRISNGKTITAESYAQVGGGVTVFSSQKRYAAEGQVLHLVNLAYAIEETDLDESSSMGGSEGGMTLSIDGTPSTEVELNPETTLVISAAENAEIILKAQTDGVSQGINLKTGERTTTGIAESWYAPSKHVLDNGNINQKVTSGKESGTLKMTVSKAERTPWTEDLGWSDSGKSSWLIVGATEPEWSFNNGSSPTNEVAKIWVTDSEGNKYEREEINAYDSDTSVFSVPSAATDFTIHTENSSEITSWGDIVGKTKTVKNEFPITLK